MGRRPGLRPQAATLGATTAGELRDLDARQARQLGVVVLERVVRELRGVPCLGLELVPPTRKGCAVTRSFGRPVVTLDDAAEAVAAHATRAAEKLRQHGLVAGQLTAFVHTSSHRPGPQRYAARSTRLVPMTADTRDLAAWRSGYSYVKAGVILDDLRAAAGAPPLLFGEPQIGSDALMRAVDAINHRFGRGTIYPAVAGIAQAWSQRPARVSPRYTTRLEELPTVRA